MHRWNSRHPVLRPLILVSVAGVLGGATMSGCATDTQSGPDIAESAVAPGDNQCWGSTTRSFSAYGSAVGGRNTDANVDKYRAAVCNAAKQNARAEVQSKAAGECAQESMLCAVTPGLVEVIRYENSTFPNSTTDPECDCVNVGPMRLACTTKAYAYARCDWTFFNPCDEERSVAGGPSGDGDGCTVDPCEGVLCPTGSTCSEGICSPVDLCADVVCPIGSPCINGVCQSLDPCANVLCGIGETCVSGQCVSSGCSGDFDCPPGQYCWGHETGIGQCAPMGSSCVQDGFCSADETCSCDAACCGGGGGGSGSGPGGSCGWSGEGPISYGDCFACGGSVEWSSTEGAFMCEGVSAQ